jgi:inosine-uridine nucleoside N-ribohydrolase
MKSIILDHDAGTNPDDFFSLLMLLNSPDINLKLVISGNNYPMERARFVHKIIEQHGKQGVTVYAGEATGHIDFNAHQYIEGYEPEISTDYPSAIKEVFDACDEVIYLSIQGLSNLAVFLRAYPEYQDTFDVVHMGMKIGDTGEFISGGTNMEADALAAKYVYELDLRRFKVVGSHTTINDAIRITPQTALYQKLATSNSPNHQMLLSHLHDYYQRRTIWPALHDPLTTSVALGYGFVSFCDYRVEFNNEGLYRLSDTGVIVTNSEATINNPEKFMQLMVEMI